MLGAIQGHLPGVGGEEISSAVTTVACFDYFETCTTIAEKSASSSGLFMEKRRQYGLCSFAELVNQHWRVWRESDHGAYLSILRTSQTEKQIMPCAKGSDDEHLVRDSTPKTVHPRGGGEGDCRYWLTYLQPRHGSESRTPK